jgi:diguanylate cyclase (GGDEF)-like protein
MRPVPSYSTVCWHSEQSDKTVTGTTTLPLQRHILLIKDSDGYRVIALEASSHSIGREQSNSIVLASKDVSRQHAILLRVSSTGTQCSSFMLIDGDLQGKRSRNGIQVNGHHWSTPHRLQDGDAIRFANQVYAKYMVVAEMDDATFAQYCDHLDFGQLLSPDAPGFRSSPNVEADPQQDSANDAYLIRLASFPEINPSPMFEVNLQGQLTYLNPAGAAAFADLPEIESEHPMLQGLFSLIQASESKILVREVSVGDRVFEQSIHYIPESDLIRCCAFDITQRKHAESELLQRDRLLQSVADATTHLLENVAYDAAIDAAIATLGNAAGADRICISANHLLEDQLYASLKFEWSREPQNSLLHAQHRYNRSYRAPGFRCWYEPLTQESAICGQLADFSPEEQQLLAQDDIQAILVVPIVLQQRFWGFIELHHCRPGQIWSRQDESIAFAMAASISAALQRQQTDQIIHHQAFHDALTDLPNRILFQERLEAALSESKQSSQPLAVMFIDLDRFKRINDTLGHTIGDQLLREVSGRLSRCLRTGSLVSRWGGDEFTVLLTELASVQEAQDCANRILDTLQKPFLIGSHELFIGASIGIAPFPDAGQEAEVLLQNADVALYQCKERKVNGFQVYTSSMNSLAPELFMLENSFRHALDRGEFQLHYQPKVNLQTEQIVGVEALIRWQHPEMGLVSPALFIPLAEETGFIVEIGQWVLRTACRDLMTWYRAGYQPLTVAVNLSPRQFFHPELCQEVTQAIATSQIDPAWLELEITETTAVQNMEFTITLLEEFKRMGVKLAMDDFGTGYSSLSYLKRMPLDVLKIDRSFIKDLKPNTKDQEIIRAMVSLAAGLNLEVVAEGVDAAEQIEVLKALNCSIAQGFYFSRPLDYGQITDLLAQNFEQPPTADLMFDLSTDEPGSDFNQSEAWNAIQSMT